MNFGKMYVRTMMIKSTLNILSMWILRGWIGLPSLDGISKNIILKPNNCYWD